MKRRRLLLLMGLVTTAATMGCLALWLTSLRHRINEESVKLIQEGMTQADVQAVFGVPPGDYSNGGIPIYSRDSDWLEPVDRKEWIGDAVAVEVFFDSAGKVLHVYQNQVAQFPDESLPTRVRHWLGM